MNLPFLQMLKFHYTCYILLPVSNYQTLNTSSNVHWPAQPIAKSSHSLEWGFAGFQRETPVLHVTLRQSSYKKLILNSSRINYLNTFETTRWNFKPRSWHDIKWFEMIILSKFYQIILSTHPEWLSISLPQSSHIFPMASRVGTSSILANLLDCYLQMGPSTHEQPGTKNPPWQHRGEIIHLLVSWFL